MTEPCLFASMGMFIIDEIHYPEESNQEPQYDIIGGGGTYGALGSRIVTTSKQAARVGWILDKGSDFPENINQAINSWETGVVVRTDTSRLTTRGWNMYGKRDFRAFKYQTEKKRIEVDDIVQYPQLANSLSFHLICSPARCIQIMDTLESNRSTPYVVAWEPVPDSCNPENLENCLEILDRIDILTPNAEEAARFFRMEEPSEPAELEALAAKFLPYMKKESMFSTGSGVVLRCGPLGCFIITSKGFQKWLPAYHGPSNPSPKVIDPTGGGNTFIGGFCTAFVIYKGDWERAGVCGNLAAGCAIEQIGAPVLDQSTDRWGGASLHERLANYTKWNGLKEYNL